MNSATVGWHRRQLAPSQGEGRLAQSQSYEGCGDHSLEDLGFRV